MTKEKRTKSTNYYCKKCGTIETIPDNLDGIDTEDCVKILCPKCMAKGSKRRMYKVKEKL